MRETCRSTIDWCYLKCENKDDPLVKLVVSVAASFPSCVIWPKTWVGEVFSLGPLKPEKGDHEDCP